MPTAEEEPGRTGSRLPDEVSEVHRARDREELDERRERTRDGTAGPVREAKRQL
ncbi:hypothetical protein [Streptomyces sp. SID8014]|uniref:hypothetical protein n=1 Tax=Streptomyces sp. SID8014 TaxID=2706097 RepID=UPI001EF2C3CB|nr:hypothetical protein [Streptomyces sp. SID8014]